MPPRAGDARAPDDGDGVLYWYGATHVAKAENSRRYRIENLLESRTKSTSHVGRILPPGKLRGIHTVVVVRAYVDALARLQLHALRRRGVRLVADYDDLLFDCPLDEFPPAERLRDRPRMARRLRIYRRGLDAFDAFTCSTEPIADALRRLRPDAPVELVANVPSPRWIEQGWRRFGRSAWKPGDPKVLRYLPGSPSHDRDFAVIEDVLAEFLRRHDDVALEVVGYLNFDRAKFPRDRVAHRPKVAYEDFPAVLLSTWVNLAPVAPTAYGLARSPIKLREASAFGVPTLSNHPLYPPHPSLTVARTTADWRDALEAFRANR